MTAQGRSPMPGFERDRSKPREGGQVCDSACPWPIFFGVVELKRGCREWERGWQRGDEAPCLYLQGKGQKSGGGPGTRFCMHVAVFLGRLGDERTTREVGKRNTARGRCPVPV